MTPLRKIMATVIAAPLLAGAQMAAASPADDNTPQRSVDGKGTVALPAQDPTLTADGQASFILDTTRMGFRQKLSLWAARYTAITFDGAATKPGRVCPYFNLKSYHYTIQEIRPEVFKVVTHLTPAEAETVKQAGCAITTAPDFDKVQYLPK
ncbi:MAG: hypothetical protein ACXW30_03265 [Micavibrio sp.]